MFGLHPDKGRSQTPDILQWQRDSRTTWEDYSHFEFLVCSSRPKSEPCSSRKTSPRCRGADSVESYHLGEWSTLVVCKQAKKHFGSWTVSLILTTVESLCPFGWLKKYIFRFLIFIKVLKYKRFLLSQGVERQTQCGGSCLKWRLVSILRMIC